MHVYTHAHTHSFYALFRIVPLAYRLVTLGGLQYAMCDSRLYAGSTVGGLWAFLFPLSKLFELVDTVFILLRKRNVIFLHWYHHLSGQSISAVVHI